MNCLGQSHHLTRTEQATRLIVGPTQLDYIPLARQRCHVALQSANMESGCEASPEAQIYKSKIVQASKSQLALCQVPSLVASPMLKGLPSELKNASLLRLLELASRVDHACSRH